MKRPRVPQKPPVKPQSPEPEYCKCSELKPWLDSGACSLCGYRMPQTPEEGVTSAGNVLGDKLDELQWRILTRIDPELLNYCSDGQYLIAIRIGKGPPGDCVVSACAAKTADKDRLVVAVEGSEVSLEHCCEFCARPAIGRATYLPGGACFVCGHCAGLTGLNEVERL
jgi:hypothetical protein